MRIELWVPLLSFGATLLLVMTGLLNYSVVVRQLRASREQLQNARLQLEHAQQQPEILLVQRAMAETSEHLKIFVERPYLRAYFFEDEPWKPGDQADVHEVKAIAELLLTTFASSVIHAAAFPQYPVRSVEQTIRFHLRHSPVMRAYLLEAFDRFQLAGPALLAMKNGTLTAMEADLEALIGTAEDEPERQRRVELLDHLRRTGDMDTLALARYGLDRARPDRI